MTTRMRKREKYEVTPCQEENITFLPWIVIGDKTSTKDPFSHTLLREEKGAFHTAHAKNNIPYVNMNGWVCWPHRKYDRRFIDFSRHNRTKIHFGGCTVSFNRFNGKCLWSVCCLYFFLYYACQIVLKQRLSRAEYYFNSKKKKFGFFFFQFRS